MADLHLQSHLFPTNGGIVSLTRYHSQEWGEVLSNCVTRKEKRQFLIVNTHPLQASNAIL